MLDTNNDDDSSTSEAYTVDDLPDVVVPDPCRSFTIPIVDRVPTPSPVVGPNATPYSWLSPIRATHKHRIATRTEAAALRAQATEWDNVRDLPYADLSSDSSMPPLVHRPCDASRI